MKLSITKGLDEKEAKEARAAFLEAVQFRKRLTVILNDEVRSLQASMRSESSYESPNWALIQADRVAQTKALLKVVGLISNEKKNTTKTTT